MDTNSINAIKKNKNNPNKFDSKTNIKNRKFKVVVLGASAGGLNALKTILPELPSDFKLSVIIVVHRLSDSDDYLERLLDEKCKVHVKQADEKEVIKSGVVYFAPPGYHLLIEDNGTFSLSMEGVVNYSRPSIDVLFESAAYVYGPAIVGTILTGANNDGSKGLKIIKETGGLTVVQSPETAEIDDMPNAAISVAGPDYILPLNQIGPFLGNLKCETSCLQAGSFKYPHE